MRSQEKSTNMNKTNGCMMTAAPNLLALPDDVLLVIMSYLGPLDLLNVARLSERLEELSQDRMLWTVVDTRPGRLTLSELTKVVEQLRPTTHTLATRGSVGDLPENVCISPELLIQLSSQCPALDTLILEDQFAEIDQSKEKGVSKYIQLKLFPKTLTTLSLKGCDFIFKRHQESFFHDINAHLPLLKVLILSSCSWVYPHDFIPIGKCSKLEELRLDGCYRLGECVAYTSLAARFGFPALKILDLRDTNMGDSDVSCFNRTTTLTHLYLECPSNPKNHMNTLTGIFNSSYGAVMSSDYADDPRYMTENMIRCGLAKYMLTKGGPVIVINRVGMNVEREASPQREDESPPAAAAESPNEAAGPSSSPGRILQLALPAGRSTLCPLTRSVSTLHMTPPGPSSSSAEKGQKRKSECGSSSSKRLKQDCLMYHLKLAEHDPRAEAIKGADSSSGPSNIDEKSSDSSSDDDSVDGCVLLQSKKFVRPAPLISPLWRNEREFIRNNGSPGPKPIISDLCIMSFAEENWGKNGGAADARRGGENNNWYVRLMYPEVTGTRPNLHTLVLRNFSGITDETLRLLTEHSSLRHLDVSGTSVTESAVLDFKLRRPEVEVISDFDVPF